VKEARKIVAVIITFGKSNKKSSVLQQMLKNVALLIQNSQDTGGTPTVNLPRLGV
jgi:GTP-binding protein EngB required for normal cell division